MGVQPIENKALSWGTIGKSAPVLAEITIRKSQEFTLDRRGQGAYKKVEALLSEPIFTLLPTGI